MLIVLKYILEKKNSLIGTKYRDTYLFIYTEIGKARCNHKKRFWNVIEKKKRKKKKLVTQ